ncbi:MAG: hypothetical protein U0Q18_06420 [Bryobacteraceae bacterium]
MKLYQALLAVTLLLSAVAQAAVTPAGLWEANIKTPNGDIGMLFNLHQDGEKWIGEMDVPAQHVSELPLTDVKVDGAAVTFAMPGPGDPRYSGKLSEDGKAIAGNLSQGGGSIPLELKWKSEAKAVVRAPANTGEVQVLEGTWEGALDVNGGQLHLRFNFKKNADGSIAGTIDSIDQGANGIPITSIARSGDTVKLDVKAVAGAYDASLSKDTKSMTGTWSQGGGSIPLTIQKK